ncbi:MAG: aminotransferase class I/II-fold pyridoxal phosphate-dependent enzyme, partial [Alphaproteobacteria bacterium]|nr:aminotransferase class I/II-fold pyridoxal phosphate-dependent enzyme [Alphaproteobacteria bacterium]
MAFSDDDIDLAGLRATAYNHRWAEMPEGVIPLTAADSDFGAPAFVRDALSAYAARGHFGYAPPFGLPEFRTAVSTFLDRKRGAIVPAEGIIATNGAASAVFLAARAVIPPGSTALAPDPCDFLIPGGIEAAGGRVVRYPVFRDRTMR